MSVKHTGLGTRAEGVSGMPSGSGAGVLVTAKQGTRRREHPQESRAERSETPAPKDSKDDKTSYERDERKTKRTQLTASRGQGFQKQRWSTMSNAVERSIKKRPEETSMGFHGLGITDNEARIFQRTENCSVAYTSSRI